MVPGLTNDEDSCLRLWSARDPVGGGPPGGLGMVTATDLLCELRVWRGKAGQGEAGVLRDDEELGLSVGTGVIARS